MKIKPLDSYEPELRESIKDLHRVNKIMTKWDDMESWMSSQQISDHNKIGDFEARREFQQQ